MLVINILKKVDISKMLIYNRKCHESLMEVYFYMFTSKELYIDNGIDIYDGYKGDQIWTLPENYSTYCSREIDSQCTVPIQNFEEIMNKLSV